MGVDAGKSGGVAFYDTVADTIDVEDIPLDSSETLDSNLLFMKLLDWQPQRVVVEDCWRPKSLVRMVGEIVCLGKILQAEVKVVAVVSWKQKLIGYNTSDKKASVQRCLELRPQMREQLMRGKKSVNPNPDRAEAVLLAIYGASL